jgi:hypothetical protein
MPLRSLRAFALVAALLSAGAAASATGSPPASAAVSAAAVSEPGAAGAERRAPAATQDAFFAQLRKFAGTVLVPPPGLAPFDGLVIYRVETGRVLRAGPPRGRYVIQYRDADRDPIEGQAQLGGTIGRTDFDDALVALVTLSFRRCAPDAPYCVENVGGQDGALPASELFRDLAVGDGPAVAEHVTCCGGHYWTLTWFDPAREMTYELVLLAALADRYGTEITPDNRAAALALAELASRLEPLR